MSAPKQSDASPEGKQVSCPPNASGAIAKNHKNKAFTALNFLPRRALIEPLCGKDTEHDARDVRFRVTIWH